MDKKSLRKFFQKKRDSISDNEIYKRSLTICERFFDSNIYKTSQKIFTYINYKSEFVSSIIIKKAFSDKKIVAVPVISKNAHEMFFVEIKNLDELSKNKFGILEPKLVSDNILKPDLKTIIIVPALAFDKKGFRLGYGGGFYDKYLSENKSFLTIGCAFDFQIVNEIVHTELDIPVDLILSENIIIDTQKKIYQHFSK